MPSRLRAGCCFLLASLLFTSHGGAIAQRYVPMPYGGGWHGGWHGYYRPYLRPYGYAHPFYYGPRFVGYPGYFGGYGYPWFGAVIAPVIVPPPIYVYPIQPAPPPTPPTERCPDGSTITTGSYCPSRPAPASPPAALPAPGPERGERG